MSNVYGAADTRNPDYQALVAKLISLYSEITKKALDNEQAAPRRK